MAVSRDSETCVEEEDVYVSGSKGTRRVWKGLSGRGAGAGGSEMLSIVRVVVGGERMAEEAVEVRKPCMKGMVIV
jgi:hypothetical protein